MTGNGRLTGSCRMNQTMERLKKMEEREYTTLTRVLFGLDSPSPVPTTVKDVEADIGPVIYHDQTLNPSQREAVQFALASREAALIHGPPGVRLIGSQQLQG